jgi:hypothetical protein
VISTPLDARDCEIGLLDNTTQRELIPHLPRFYLELGRCSLSFYGLRPPPTVWSTHWACEEPRYRGAPLLSQALLIADESIIEDRPTRRARRRISHPEAEGGKALKVGSDAEAMFFGGAGQFVQYACDFT